MCYPKDNLGFARKKMLQSTLQSLVGVLYGIQQIAQSCLEGLVRQLAGAVCPRTGAVSCALTPFQESTTDCCQESIPPAGLVLSLHKAACS